MMRSKCAWVLGGLLLAGSVPALADGGGWSYDDNLAYDSDDGRFHLDIRNFIQSRVTFDNPDLGTSGQSFDVNHARVALVGHAFTDWVFEIETDLASGSLSDDQTESELLLDAWIKWKRKPMAQLWIGQGKVALGRQFLVDQEHLQFADRSIASDRFAHGRDVGIAIVGEARRYNYSFGIYNGNGINREVDENRDIMAAARLEVMPLGPMPRVESDPLWHRFENDKGGDTALTLAVAVLTNNMGEGSFEEERVNRGALEIAFRLRGLTLAGEFYTESRDPLVPVSPDETDTDGWYLQGGYAFPVSEVGLLEIAGRYSEILRDIADADRTEAGVAVSFFFKGHRNRVMADYRILDFEGLQFGENIDRDEARVQVQLIF